MNVTHITVDEIVEHEELPCYARGRAFFANGRAYRFSAMFAHTYGDDCIVVAPSRGEKHLDPRGRVAAAIRDRLGFTDIAERQRAALGAFEHERVAACRKHMQPDPA